MDVWDSRALSLALKSIIFVKNRGFYGYFKVRQQMTYTSRTRKWHRPSKVSKITIKNSVFEDFYGFPTLRPAKAEESSIKNAQNP